MAAVYSSTRTYSNAEEASSQKVGLSGQSVAAFYAVLGLYTAAALFLLWLGMASALAATIPSVFEAFKAAALSGSRFA